MTGVPLAILVRLRIGGHQLRPDTRQMLGFRRGQSIEESLPHAFKVRWCDLTQSAEPFRRDVSADHAPPPFATSTTHQSLRLETLYQPSHRATTEEDLVGQHMHAEAFGSRNAQMDHRVVLGEGETVFVEELTVQPTDDRGVCPQETGPRFPLVNRKTFPLSDVVRGRHGTHRTVLADKKSVGIKTHEP